MTDKILAPTWVGPVHDDESGFGMQWNEDGRMFTLDYEAGTFRAVERQGDEVLTTRDWECPHVQQLTRRLDEAARIIGELLRSGWSEEREVAARDVAGPPRPFDLPSPGHPLKVTRIGVLREYVRGGSLRLAKEVDDLYDDIVQAALERSTTQDE